MSFTYIDLFAGIGGFRTAIDAVGGRCVGFSEIDKYCIETYLTNYKDKETDNLGDITKIDKLPQVDLLVGGVPCQSWSVAKISQNEILLDRLSLFLDSNQRLRKARNFPDCRVAV